MQHMNKWEDRKLMTSSKILQTIAQHMRDIKFLKHQAVPKCTIVNQEKWKYKRKQMQTEKYIKKVVKYFGLTHGMEEH